VAGDVNGDGVREVTLSDPRATINGDDNAGALYVVDGVTGTVASVHQDLPEIPWEAEPGNRFGQSMAVYDANRDGCADVAVGLPNQDVAGAIDAGEVLILFGSPAGLGMGPAAVSYVQGRDGVPGTPDSHDWFGYSLTAGLTADGAPFLIVGVPGEDAGGQPDSGVVHYFRGMQKLMFDQAQVGVGAVEADDRFGNALASTATHFAVARPGEMFAAGTSFAGSVCAFNHPTGSALPTAAGCADQDSPGVPGVPEAGDVFGTAVAMAPYWPTGDSILVVGAPGDDLGGVADAGSVHQFRVTNTAVTHLATVTQATAGMSGSSEVGDLFGQDVVVVNINPGAEPTAQTLLVAVGAPGEDLVGGEDAGEVRVFAAGTETGLADTTVYRRAQSLPGSPAPRELIGSGLSGTQGDLFVASPYGIRELYAIPWQSLAGGTAVPTRTWAPGQGGFPTSATAFGVQVG
jgi:hypothetical protein